VTKPSFGQSLLTFARSDALPLSGYKAAYLLNQFKPIREALELMEERWRESLQENHDGIPGWQLVPGANVRELKGATALNVWEQFQEGDDCPLSVEEFLACCRVSLTALEKEIGLPEADKSKRFLNRRLGELLTYRQNRPSLKRLSRSEALAQAARLEERGQEE
jgi:hypothetical protein